MAIKLPLGKCSAITPGFWRYKSLKAFSRQEWEAVCDRCGLCCLVKLQDAQSGQVVYTDVACRYLDINACTCRVYDQRKVRMAECLELTPANLGTINWLPPTCSYRLIRAGRPLPPWHPLVSGAADSVHQGILSARHIAVANRDLPTEELIRHAIDLGWDGGYSPWGEDCNS